MNCDDSRAERRRTKGLAWEQWCLWAFALQAHRQVIGSAQTYIVVGDIELLGHFDD